MESIKCDYCNNLFKTNSNLKTHQTTAKYCIKLQKIKNNNDINNKLLNCEYCSKLFAYHKLNTHLNVCKMKKLKIIEEKDKIIFDIKKEKEDQNNLLKKQIELIKKEHENQTDVLKKQIELIKKEHENQTDVLKKEHDEQFNLLKKELYLLKKEKTYFENRSINYKEQLDKRIEEINNLQNRLEKLALKAIEKPTNSTSTHNTIINNLPAFHSQEFINNKIQDKFDDRYFHNEMKSIAQFTYDHILTLDNGNLVYVCCDYGRKNFKYKDENGNEITDPEAIKLIDMIQDKLYDKTCYLHDWAVNEYDYLKMQEERDELVDKKELNSVIDMIGKAQDMKMVIKSMNKTNKFSNELAKLTVVKK